MLPVPDGPGKRGISASVNLLGHYAGFISRLTAFIVDTLIISASVVATTWFVSVTTTTFRFGTFIGFSVDSIPGVRSLVEILTGPIVTGLVTFLYILSYHVFFWIIAGQTPGKALIGLRIVTLDGHRLTPWRAFIRFLAYFISAIPLYLGFLWVIIDDYRQGWHDKLAGTYVIYAWAARPDELFLRNEIKLVDAGKSPPGLLSTDQTEAPLPWKSPKQQNHLNVK
jgi:uncharacterized RDD family membrane protein YckC